MNTKIQVMSLAALTALVASAPASAAVDITEMLGTLTTDGTSIITGIGLAMMGLASLAVVFKWGKAQFF
jgi:hypothetical protein